MLEVVQRRLVRSYVHRQNRTITERALTDLNRMNIPWYIRVPEHTMHVCYSSMTYNL